MNDKVFVSGSRGINKYTDEMSDKLESLIRSGAEILVGDAEGVDKLVQAYCSMFGYYNITIYCVNDRPRVYMNSKFKLKSIPSNGRGREYFAEKDKAMTQDCDYAVAFWDGLSVGTENNIKRVRSLSKEVSTIIRRS